MVHKERQICESEVQLVCHQVKRNRMSRCLKVNEKYQVLRRFFRDESFIIVERNIDCWS